MPTPLEDTQRWLEKVVIGLNLCPFAAAPQRSGRIRLTSTENTAWEALLPTIVEEVLRLDDWPPEEVATTLLLLPEAGSFTDLLALAATASDVLEEMGLTGDHQLVVFHPDFRYEGSDPDDPANLTNRSPCPLIHILREEDVDRAVAAHPDINAIPEDNAARLRALGSAAVHARWMMT
jgi:hypothetical protein